MGPNSFAAREKLKELRNQFVREQGDFALEQFDGEETSFDKVREALQSAPFLAPKKMVILIAPNAIKEYKEQYETVLNDIPETTDVVVYEPSPDKRTAYYKFLKKQKHYYGFENPDEHSLATWLVEEAKNNDGTITLADARYVISRVGTIQYALKNELDKLLSYNTTITRSSIDLLTEPSPKTTIFELLEAAFSGNTQRAMSIYAEQRQLKVEPQQIIAMLAWQLHILALIATAGSRSDGEIAQASKMSPYVISKSRPLLKTVGASRLKTLISELTQLDYKGKTSAIDVDRGLQTYLATIS